MEIYPIMIDEAPAGKLTVERQGARTVFSAECRMLPGVVRISVYGGGREGYLGVLAPEGEALRLKKSLSRNQMREFPPEIDSVERSGLNRPDPLPAEPEPKTKPAQVPETKPEPELEPEAVPEPAPQPAPLPDCREQPAAKPVDLNFFFTDFTSISCTLFDGRIRTAAPIRPESSSTAKRTFSMCRVGSMSTVMPLLARTR